MSRFSTCAAAVLAAGFLMLAGVANAQDAAQPSEAEIDTYAAAVVALQDVVAEYRAEVSNAESEAAVNEIQQEYQEVLAQTVRNEGLTVERYNEIFTAAQNDQALTERINERIQAIQ